ncbi:45254_t:CDS:1, partial [Gigaspora margarita]
SLHNSLHTNDEEIILQCINEIKQTQGSSDFDAALELMKITTKEIFDNFETILNDRQQAIEILTKSVLFLTSDVEYFKSVYFESVKKEFKQNLKQCMYKFITLLPQNIQDKFKQYEDNILFKYMFDYYTDRLSVNFSSSYAFILKFLYSYRLLRVFE